MSASDLNPAIRQILAANLGAAHAAEALRAKNVNLLPSHLLALTAEEEAACVAWANGEITDKALESHFPNAWRMIKVEGAKSHYVAPPPLGPLRKFE